jgi:hypothetical protein
MRLPFNVLGRIIICSHIRASTVQRGILSVEQYKTKRRRKNGVYALTGFSWAIFQMKKKPRDSITVRTESAYKPLGNGYAHG